MKKIFAMMMFAAAAFVACEKDNGDQKGPNFGTVTYEGVTYKTVTLADGNTWMAENLRYVPEGKTVSDAADGTTGVWYPYNVVEKEGAFTSEFAKDEETIKTKGYLYAVNVAFGVSELTAENVKTLEGCQGICPDGWHIPTLDELIALVGKGSKLSSAAVGSYEKGTTPEDKDAVFYNETYDGGNIKEMNEAGFGFVYSGAKSGATLLVGVKNGYETKPITYLLGSTFYNTGNTGVHQFLSLMSTCNATYPEGRLTASFQNHTMVSAVRCVKNK